MDGLKKLQLYTAALKFVGVHLKKRTHYYRLWLLDDSATKKQRHNYRLLYEQHRTASKYWGTRCHEITIM